MALYPGATYRPITANKNRRRMVQYNRVNAHVAVSNAASLWPYFNKSGIPDSHFYVRKDGSSEQYVDTAFMAFADLDGNDATISIETQGDGDEPFTPQQVETIAQIYAWAVKTHGIPIKQATNSKMGATSHGLSWHRIGIDGNFPSLPDVRAGRIQRGGGMRYSKSYGKGCPGDKKIYQMDDIYARAVKLLAVVPTPTPPKEDDVPKFRQFARTSAQTDLKPNVETVVRLSNDGQEISYAFGKEHFVATLNLWLDGLPKGAEVQVKAALVDPKTGKQVSSYNVSEIVGTSGGTFGQYVVTGIVPAGQRARFYIKAFHNGVTIRQAVSRVTYWSV